MTHGIEAATDLTPEPYQLDGANLLEALRESFDAASAPSGAVDRDFEIARARVRLRSASADHLAIFAKAFEHLRVETPGEPALTIHFWDSETHGTPPPPTPEVGDEQAPGAFFYASDDRVRMGFQLGTSGDARELSIYNGAPTPALSVLDEGGGEAWHWVADAARIPYWDEAAPMRFLLDWWLRSRGVHLLHSGAVGATDGGVLLVGKGGSGKSTSSLSTLQSELLYAADDYVAVTLEPEPWAHSVYGSGKLMPDHVRRLPFLLPVLANSDLLEFEKAVVYVHEHWPERVTTEFPLRAILVPRVVPGRTEAVVVETSPLAGLAALAPSTVFQMHTRGQDSLARMKKLAETIPSFSLELGSDIESIPRAISELLDGLRG
jgi:hypothetical protein